MRLSYTHERKLLQTAVFLGGFVPVLAGGAGAILGQSFLSDGVVDPALDNHFRYLSGLLLGLGLSFWSFIPRIETHAPKIRTLTLLVVVGGLARLYGMIAIDGAATLPALLALGMELAVTPLLCLWQGRIAGKTP